MAEYDMSRSTTNSAQPTAYEVDGTNIDYSNVGTGETYWDFPNARTNFDYYQTIPEFKKALDALATWTTGKGWETESLVIKAELEHLTGWGEDTFQSIMWNLVVVKKVVGDSFAEIITRDGKLINLKPISPERMRLVLDKNGMIKRYDVKNFKGEFTPLETRKILHLCNDRIADQIHGTSVLDACKWVIDARNEALADTRKVYHRNVFPLQIIEYDGEDTTKRDLLLNQYAAAITAGTALVVPKGVITITQADIKIQDPIAWLNFLQNYFYQVVRIPRIIATSEGTTEAGGKLGYLTFEPMYTYEQAIYEAEIWNALAIRIKFKRPASLGGTIQEDEEKNTGQVAVQPNDVEASMTRE